MKLDSSLNYYNKLIDKSLDLNERLKLGESLWHLEDTAQVQGNKQQLIIDWTIDLLINKRRYSFSENDFNSVLERLNLFLHDEKFKNTPINGGLNFVQVLFEAFNSNNEFLKKTVHECCFRLFQTKFSQYFTRNIDQMTRIVNFYIIDINGLLMNGNSSELVINESLTRVNLILQKYFLCFKSQQNQNRLFNRLCVQILFNLLNLIENLSVKSCGQEVCDISWKILKYGLFSKLHSNTYQDFFKNLPASFSTKSNYQVAILFTTIQIEASKNQSNLRSICKVIHLLIREILKIMNVDDYKIKMSMIKFIINLLWGLKDNVYGDEKMDTDVSQREKNSLSSENMDLINAAMGNMLQIIDDLRLFNKIDDGNNQNMFKTWSKDFIIQTFNCKFNEIYAEFLTKFLLIDHVILDPELETILKYLQIENNLTKFLNIYLECNVKFRQLSRATHILIDVLGKNDKLILPIEFHTSFSNSLESYNVDSQSVIHLWKELNCLLKNCTETNLKMELLKFLTGVLSRVNLTNQRLPTHLKAQAMEYLEETKIIISDHLVNETEFSDENELLVYFLECFYTCGLLYLILYRFSITSSSHLTNATSMITIEHSKACLNNLTDFLTILNKSFQLDDKIEKQLKIFGKNFRILFYLNKLQLLNIFDSNLKEITTESSKCVSKLLSSVEKFDQSKCDYNYIETYNIEKEIKSVNDFAALNLKYLVLDNFYLITPLLTNDKYLMEKYLMIILQFISKSNDRILEIEKINLNSIFNDKSIVNGLLVASIKILINESNNDTKVEKFLNKLIELVQSDGKDDELKATLFESKKYKKVSLNESQASLVIELASYFPLEFFETKHALVFYFLNEKIIAYTSVFEEKKINIYFRLFSSIALIEEIPILNIKNWIVDLLSLYETDTITKLSNSIFEKLIKKCAKKLLMDDSLDCLTDFVDNLIEKLSGTKDNLNFVSFAHLTLIQVLENISKVQEFTLTLKKDHENMTNLNGVFNKILNFFMGISKKVNSTKETEYLSEFQENHLFYICLILTRRICSSIESINHDNVEQFEYFKNLYNTCLKTHKEKIKMTKVTAENQSSIRKINAFHIDFVKSCIYFSETLSTKDESLRIKPVKLCKNLIDLLFALNDNYAFDMNYLSKLNPNSTYGINDSSNNLQSLKYILIKSIALSMNTFDVEDTMNIFEYFESQVILNKCSDSIQSCYVSKINRLAEFISFATCDIEIREELKLKFSEFAQKILVQLQPLYTTLKATNQIDDIISLLKLQTKIVGSKYFLFPSHLVISTLQTFVSLDLNQFSLEKYVDFQELACKSMNNILNRYSKKFGKIAAVICNLLTKLIVQTTTLSNQSNLTEASLPFAIKASQDIERIITRLSAFKKNFCKIAPYMISEYACIANTIPIHPSVKNILASAMYNLISICDIYGISQLHVALPVGAKEHFKTIYAEYEKYFKYTGKT